MFKLVGVLNDCLKGTIVKAVEVIDVNLESCLTLSRTGNKYAQQFEADADIELEKRKTIFKLVASHMNKRIGQVFRGQPHCRSYTVGITGLYLCTSPL
jgi:hypothetical protein